MQIGGHMDQTLQTRQNAGLYVAQYLAVEGGFWKVVRELEEDPLFLRLWQRTASTSARAIRIVPRRGAHVTDPQSIAGRRLADVEALLVGFQDVIAALRALGRHIFAACFLDEGGVTLAEMADATGLPIDRLRQFQSEVTDRVVIADLVEAAPAAPAGLNEAARLEPVARIGVRNGHLHLESFFDRVRYHVDEKAVQDILRADNVSAAEQSHWSEMRRRIHWINVRYNLLHRLLEIATSRQEPYLLSGRDEDRGVLEMKSVAAEIGVDTSWVSRLIRGKSVLTPAGSIALRELFHERRHRDKAAGKRILRSLLEQHKDVSDGELQKALAAAGIRVARRTVNAWRRGR